MSEPQRESSRLSPSGRAIEHLRFNSVVCEVTLRWCFCGSVDSVLASEDDLKSFVWTRTCSVGRVSSHCGGANIQRYDDYDQFCDASHLILPNSFLELRMRCSLQTRILAIARKLDSSLKPATWRSLANRPLNSGTRFPL